MTKLQTLLEEKILAQMNIEDRSQLELWKNNAYHMNQNIANQFWDTIAQAPYVYIVNDYDVDGICAGYIMSKAIRHRHPQLPICIRTPRRLSEGYGINWKIVEEIKEKVPKGGVIVTVDNGIACADILEHLKQEGYKVLLTDHHELGKNKIPEVDMVINPKVPINGTNYFNGDYWCGAAVAYKLAESFISEDLRQKLEIFAGIATIADIMPLKEGNWAMVRRTMHKITQKKAPASLLMLFTELKQNVLNLQETTISFYLAPTMNAPGRLYDDGPKKVLSYLLNPTMEKCKELVAINEERKTLKQEQWEEIKAIIYEKGMENDCPIWVEAPHLHEGIIGILAGKVVEEFGVPAIVLTASEKDPTIYKGSVRSAGDIDIFQYLCNMDQCFLGFGGHPGAAGLSMKKDQIAIARTYQLPKPTIQQNNIQITIQPDQIDEVTTIIDQYRPFGEENPMPDFSVDINMNTLPKEQIRFVGQPPIHLCISDPIRQYKILHFNHVDEEDQLMNRSNFRLIGDVHYEEFRDTINATLVAHKMEDIDISEHEYDKEM